MKHVRLTDVGFTPDETLVFAYEAELHEGRDFDGKFGVQFVLARNSEGAVRFGVARESGVLGFVAERDTRRAIEALLDKQAWMACINYESISFEPTPGIVEVPLTARITGEAYDWVEEYELQGQDLAAIREMQTTIVELAG